MEKDKQREKFFKIMLDSRFHNINDNTIYSGEFHINASPGESIKIRSDKVLVDIPEDLNTHTGHIPYVGTEILIRKYLKVDFVDTLVLDYLKFDKDMRTIVAIMLQELRNQHGFGPEEYSIGHYYAKFKHNNSDSYFKTINSEIVELRLISNCKKVGL